MGGAAAVETAEAAEGATAQEARNGRSVCLGATGAPPQPAGRGKGGTPARSRWTTAAVARRSGRHLPLPSPPPPPLRCFDAAACTAAREGASTVERALRTLFSFACDSTACITNDARQPPELRRSVPKKPPELRRDDLAPAAPQLIAPACMPHGIPSEERRLLEPHSVDGPEAPQAREGGGQHMPPQS